MCTWFYNLMLLIVQRYKNESNSQPSKLLKNVLIDAFDSSKIQKWKQFTTDRFGSNSGIKMLLIVQRYKNESNSQPVGISAYMCLRCFW